jgi:hypothetical protein
MHCAVPTSRGHLVGSNLTLVLASIAPSPRIESARPPLALWEATRRNNFPAPTDDGCVVSPIFRLGSSLGKSPD